MGALKYQRWQINAKVYISILRYSSDDKNGAKSWKELYFDFDHLQYEKIQKYVVRR